MIRKLPTRQQIALRLRSQGKTFEQIGARFNASKQYGAQLVRQGLAGIQRQGKGTA